MTTTAPPKREELRALYERVRGATVALCEPLTVEDHVVQSFADASPAKWHLAHTTWFFETLIIDRTGAEYTSPDARYRYLFNSYYNTLGEQFHRPDRGTLSRPTVQQVYDYRRVVDETMLRVLEGSAGDLTDDIALLVELGLHHEQQHQELLLTDIKHAFGHNPTQPEYRSHGGEPSGSAPPLDWVPFPGGVSSVGAAGDRFCFDNERPVHDVLAQPFALANRLVTCGEFRRFIEDGGYEKSTLWLSDGWNALNEHGWKAPLYWNRSEDGWTVFTLVGPQPISDDEPVAHINYYEADAFARWSGARLPREYEWEIAAAALPVEGNLLEANRLHPCAPIEKPSGALLQTFGDVWEWTSSAYADYPGYVAPEGPLAEYNAKFMCNQMVLRGGSCATSQSHIRPTYRNFFPPDARWQFSGLRLAKDVR